MQTLQNQLGAVTGKIKAEEAQNKAKNDKKEETFFEKSRKKFFNPEGSRPEDEYAQAVALGRGRTNAFMNAVYDPKHPDHDKNLAAYQDLYEGKLENVERHMIAKSSAELDAPNPEDMKQDPTYERNIADRYRPGTSARTVTNTGAKMEAPNPGSKDYHAFYNILLNNLKESRDRVGYGPGKQTDKAVVDAWRNKYAPNSPEWTDKFSSNITSSFS